MEASFAAANALLESTDELPQLVVVDLDYTFWKGYCEFHARNPPKPYPDAIPILKAMVENSVPIAVASRASCTQRAQRFLQHLGVFDWFCQVEVFAVWADNKREHFRKLHSGTGVPLESILFFDDDPSNIHVAQADGITAVLVREGLSLQSLRTGLDQYITQAKQRGSSNKA